MTVQRDRMREILLELADRGIFTVVGGPWISVAENWFDGLVDVIFVGEAEETWPRFLEEWARGEHAQRYEQAEKTDMTKVPLPRYDLVPFRDYAMGCVQTSRGCPYQCEFCDIIVIFGRRPRIKRPAQVVAGDRHPASPGGPGHLPGRRQLHRQQEGRQGDPPRDHRLAAGARLSGHLLHRGLA